MEPAKRTLLDKLRGGVKSLANQTYRGGAGFLHGIVKSINGVTNDAYTNWPGRKTRGRGTGDEVFAHMIGGWGQTMSPASWSGNRIEQINHYRHFVYRAIGTIMTLATKEPPYAVSVAQRESKKRYDAQVKHWLRYGGTEPQVKAFLADAEVKKSLASIKPNEAFQHLEEYHDLQRLLDNPNDLDTGGDLWRELLMYQELTGNSYLWKVEKKSGHGLAELWVMPAHWVWPVSTGGDRIVEYYNIYPWGNAAATGMPIRFDADEFIHIHYKSPLNKIDGQSPLQAGDTVIDTYESLQLARLYSIKTGAQVGTVFQCDASYDPDDTTIARWESKLFAKFQGERGFMRPAVLPPGMSLVRPPPETELSFINSSDQLRDYVLALWGLSKVSAGFTDAVNRATFEGAMAAVYYSVINPRLSMIGTVLTEKLAKPYYGRDKRVFWPDMTPADRQAQLAEWNALMQNCRFTDNEFRAWMNLEPIEGGDTVNEPQGKAPAGIGDQGLTPEEQTSDESLFDRIRAGGKPSGTPGDGGDKRFTLNGHH